SSGRSRFHLACLNPDGFPDLKSGAFTHSFSISVDALKDLIERTQFAISNEETRYYLNGIFVHTVDGPDGVVMRAVATDGHRLAGSRPRRRRARPACPESSFRARRWPKC